MSARLARLFVCLALTGCASSPIKTEDATEVTGTMRTLLADQPGVATVIVKRNRAFGGGLCGKEVLATGAPVANLGTGEKVTFRLPAGRHILGVRTTGPCPGSQRELSITLAPGDYRTFVVDIGYHGDLIFDETAF